MSKSEYQVFAIIYSEEAPNKWFILKKIKVEMEYEYLMELRKGDYIEYEDKQYCLAKRGYNLSEGIMEFYVQEGHDPGKKHFIDFEGMGL